jgi:hypothetical protein
MQDRPICFECHRTVEYDPVFEAVCGHDGCPSAVFHGLCLMAFRERREQIKQASSIVEVMGLLVRPWTTPHTENEEER